MNITVNYNTFNPQNSIHSWCYPKEVGSMECTISVLDQRNDVSNELCYLFCNIKNWEYIHIWRYFSYCKQTCQVYIFSLTAVSTEIVWANTSVCHTQGKVKNYTKDSISSPVSMVSDSNQRRGVNKMVSTGGRWCPMTSEIKTPLSPKTLFIPKSNEGVGLNSLSFKRLSLLIIINPTNCNRLLAKVNMFLIIPVTQAIYRNDVTSACTLTVV